VTRTGCRRDSIQPRDAAAAPSRWRDLGWPAALVGIGILLLWSWSIPRAIEVGSPRPTIGTFDYYNYFLPRFEFGSREMAAGRLPVWNEFEYAGIPFLATAQPAALYPPKILAFAWLDAGTAMQAFLIAHFVILAAGFLLFARQRGITGLGALAGTVYWTFTTTILLSNYHPNRIACMVWVPIVFALADSAARSWKGYGIPALALVIALQLVAGYPALTLSLAPLLAVHAIAMYWTGGWDQPPWKTLPRVAGAFVLGSCIAGLQLVPLAEIASIARRATEVADASPPFLPSISFLINERGPAGWHFVLMSFPGLAGLWIAALVRKNALPATAGAATCLAFALGGWLLIRFIPGFSLIRHGLVWLFLLQFHLAWLVAVGAEALVRADADRAWVRRWTRICVAIGGLAWAGLCGANFGPESEGIRPESGGRRLIPLSSRLYGGDDANLLGLAGGVILAAAACVPGSTGRKWTGLAGVSALMLGQVAAYPFGGATGRFGYPHAPFRIRALAERAGVVPAGRSISEIDRTHGTGLSERVAVLLGMEITFAPPRFAELQHQLISPIDQRVIWRRVLRAAGLLDAMNVDLLVGPGRRADDFRKHGLVPMGPKGTRRSLYRNEDRIGEAWVSYRAQPVTSAEQALEHLLEPDFDPRSVVIVETPLANRYRSRALLPPTPAQVRRPSPTQVDVEVETSRAGILVLSDAWYPGWEARIDDQPAEILRVDYVLRGLELAPGRHRIRFEYRPASLRYGLAASVAGLVVALVLLVASSRRGASLS